MSIKAGGGSFIAAMVAVLFAIIALPGFFKYWRDAGTGHAFGDIYTRENLRWDAMNQAARAPYIARAEAEGLKCALLMTAGQHIPLLLFVLVTIGLLTRSISGAMRQLLRFSFFGVWFFGTLFLSFGLGYWGQAIPFPASLGPAFILYLVVVAFFGAIIGFVKLCRTLARGASASPQNPAERGAE